MVATSQLRASTGPTGDCGQWPAGVKYHRAPQVRPAELRPPGVICPPADKRPHFPMILVNPASNVVLHQASWLTRSSRATSRLGKGQVSNRLNLRVKLLSSALESLVLSEGSQGASRGLGWCDDTDLTLTGAVRCTGPRHRQDLARYGTACKMRPQVHLAATS
ncbi:hypothetical protein RRG08_007966 [Elysia crispata]|uniref:Uncharacterized protein n=1 Tax=Elysia crispata TaxID=231223 RepID=A0AAE0ZQ54_9GAST|nr:hypothetical protein RRG08_007966 [Elysia crispata]